MSEYNVYFSSIACLRYSGKLITYIAVTPAINSDEAFGIFYRNTEEKYPKEDWKFTITPPIDFKELLNKMTIRENDER